MARRVIATATVNVNADTSAFRGEVGRLGGSSVKSKIGKVAGLIGGLGLAGLGKEALEFGGEYRKQLDNASAAVAGLVPNQQKAKDLLEGMTDFAINTPFDLPGVQNATTRLLAFGKGFGVTSDNVIPWIKTIGDAAAISGKGADSMSNVITTLGKISGQGKATSRDFNQLTANFPSLHPWEVLSELTGKTEGELRELAKKPGGLSGVVDPTVLINALRDEMTKLPGASDAMERKMGTLEGTMEQFKDTMGVALANGLQPFFKTFGKVIADPKMQTGLSDLAISFGTLAGALIEGLVPILPDLVSSFQKMVEALIPAMPAVATLGEAFGSALQILAPAIDLIAGIVGWLAKLLKVVDPKILGVITIALTAMWIAVGGPISPIVFAIGGLIAVAAILFQKLGGFKELVKPIVAAWNWLFDNVLQPIGAFVMDIIHWFEHLFDVLVGNSIIPDLVEAVVGLFTWLWDHIVAIFNMIVDFIIAVWNGIWNAIKTVLQLIVAGITLYFNIYKAVIMFVFNFVRDFVMGVWDTIKNGVTGAASWVSKKIGDMVSFVTGLPGRIANTISTLWEPLKRGITIAKDWVGDKIDAVVGFATRLPGRLAGLFGGMWDGIKNAFRSAINFVIRGWNALHFSVPGFSAFGVSVGGFSVGVPTIRELARGGIVDHPTFAQIGERGREAVIPLTNPARAMQLMQQSGLDRLAARMSGPTGPLITMPGAIIQDATDADLVAQRTLVAMRAAMLV